MEAITGREPVGKALRAEDGYAGAEAGGRSVVDPLPEIGAAEPELEVGMSTDRALVTDKPVGRIEGRFVGRIPRPKDVG
jgi:hypothetical protein